MKIHNNIEKCGIREEYAASREEFRAKTAAVKGPRKIKIKENKGFSEKERKQSDSRN